MTGVPPDGDALAYEDGDPVAHGDAAESPPAPRRATARWLLRQIAFWLLIPVIVALIWRVVTWPVDLPRR